MPYDWGSTQLPELSTEDTMFRDFHPRGGFRFRKHLTIMAPNGRYSRPTPMPAAIALALTEICCEHGYGMVYFFPRPEDPDFLKREPSQEKEEAIRIWYRLPELIYVARVWDDGRKGEWRSLNHEDRMTMLNARCGGIMREDPIMAIDLAYIPDDPEPVEVNAFHDEQAGCKARMVVTPHMHLGWGREMLKPTYVRPAKADRVGWTDGHPIKYGVDSARLATGRITTAEALSQRLWDMYRSEEPWSIARFGELTEALGELHSLCEQLTLKEKSA